MKPTKVAVTFLVIFETLPVKLSMSIKINIKIFQISGKDSNNKISNIKISNIKISSSKICGKISKISYKISKTISNNKTITVNTTAVSGIVIATGMGLSIMVLVLVPNDFE